MRPTTYDRMMCGSNQRHYYQNSGYFNFGYWGAGAKSQQEASDALIDQMVARIGNKSGRILDVACGLGGSTKRLAQTYAPEKITSLPSIRSQLLLRTRPRYTDGLPVELIRRRLPSWAIRQAVGSPSRPRTNCAMKETSCLVLWSQYHHGPISLLPGRPCNLMLRPIQ